MSVSLGAVGLATAGGVLLWAGLSGSTPLDIVKGLASGTKPPPIDVGSPTEILGKLVTSAVGSIGGGLLSSVTGASDITTTSPAGALNTRIVSAAGKYQGVPYRWGGASPSGWDCSGFVTYVLHHDVGLALPSNTHTTSQVFYVWSGATTIPTSQCQAGDLVCWLSHIAIATGPDTCIGAENPSQGTVTGPISQMGPGGGESYVIRRVKAQNTGVAT